MFQIVLHICLQLLHILHQCKLSNKQVINGLLSSKQHHDHDDIHVDCNHHDNHDENHAHFPPQHDLHRKPQGTIALRESCRVSRAEGSNTFEIATNGDDDNDDADVENDDEAKSPSQSKSKRESSTNGDKKNYC